MLRLLVAALATFTFVEPSTTFTSDSVYKCDDIIDVEPIKHEDFDETFLVDIKFSQAKLLGYKIYDNPETPYIDGIKWDDEWLGADGKLFDSMEYVIDDRIHEIENDFFKKVKNKSREVR